MNPEGWRVCTLGSSPAEQHEEGYDISCVNMRVSGSGAFRAHLPFFVDLEV